ncbi:hypothetical protein ColLi_12348 [Colletotrichum liriopes]|uniref:Uncharacterized protein n=1 Tax=Colletotrichum liriopes TaxID=708192 RepID=A0AA37GY87_9PEZI|nr:hypothetical protein ColLi_12348 [Colletotrichum liriopes]
MAGIAAWCHEQETRWWVADWGDSEFGRDDGQKAKGSFAVPAEGCIIGRTSEPEPAAICRVLLWELGMILRPSQPHERAKDSAASFKGSLQIVRPSPSFRSAHTPFNTPQLFLRALFGR